MPTLKILHAFAVVMHWFLRLQTICESMAPNLSVVTKQSLSADRLAIRLQLPAQPLAGHVQPALDRADRRFELTAHLLERSAANVERLQRLPVQRLEPAETVPELAALLGTDHLIERIGLDAGRVRRNLRVRAAHRTPARQAVDGHAHGDLPQPAGEAPRIAQLVPLLHHVDTDF